MSGLRLDGIDNQASGEDAILWINKPNNNDWAMIVTGNLEYGIDMRMASSHTYAYRALRAGTEYYRVGSDMVFHDSSIRTPIFYDSNNTGFYGDFASTSNFNVLRTFSYQGNGNVGGTGNASWHPSGIYSAGFNWLYGGINAGGGSATNFGDVRANIFYDNQDTSYYADYNSAGTSVRIRGGIETFANNGSILLKHSISEANAWIFQENAPNWGLFWFNAGSQSGQTIGSYSTVGAELFGMNNAVAGFNPNSAWSGTDSSTRASWMLSNFSGYIWSNSTIFAAGEMRAPIYYDANNTGFYLDPNSTSRLDVLALGNGNNGPGKLRVTGGHSDTSIRLTATGLGSGNSPTMQWWVSEPNITWDEGGFGFNVTNDGGSPNGFGRVNTSWGQAYMRFTTGGNQVFYNTNTSGTRFENMSTRSDNTVFVNNYLQAGNSLRAPFFYDSDNTAFFSNPAAGSNYNWLTINDWYYINGALGMYWNSYARGFVSPEQAGNSYGTINTWGTGRNGWSGYGIGSRWVLMSTTGDNIGIHDNQRTWMYYWNGGYHQFNYGYLEAQGSMRSPIFYDSNDTGYFLDPNTTATSLRIAGGIKQQNLVGRPYAVWGATSASGAVVIKFPGGIGNYGMIHAEINIYEYNGNAAATVIVGGHNWNGAWYNFNAEVIGQTDKPVRVGVKDGKFCIVIGNGSSGWSYGQVVLRKIQNGAYYSGVMDVAEGYTVNIESDSYSWISGDLRNLRTPSTFTAGGEVRGTLFRDTNDSGYFVDPNGESSLNQGFFWGNRVVIRGGSPTLYFRDTDENSAMLHTNSNRLYVLRGGTDSESWSTVNGYWPQYWQLNTNYSLLGGVTETVSDFRAPIFYDSNNTAFYVNPDSTSRIVELRARKMRGDTNDSLSDDQGWWTHDVYGQGWGKPHGSFRSLEVSTSGNFSTEPAMFRIHQWGSGSAEFFKPQGTTLFLRETPLSFGGTVKHGNWFTRFFVQRYIETDEDMRAPIFYDANDTGYYIDPNGGESNWQGLSRRGQAQIGLTGKTQWRRPNITGDQNYWTGIMGWGTEDFNSVMTWGSGFIDTWSNPANQPSGTSHWVGVQAHHYTNAYNSAYGWQLVGGPISNLRFRNSWPNSSGWTTVAMHDRNDGSGGALYAGLYYDSNNTGYYLDANQTSRFARTATDLTYFGSDNNKGYAEGFGTWSSAFFKIAYISFDWNATYNTYSNHGLASTDINGSFTDSVSLNSFNDINLRLDANNNNGNSYLRIHDDSTTNGQNVAYIGREGGNAIAYFYNRVYGNIYYDHDGNWYLDGNSTSRLNEVLPNTLTMAGTGVMRRSDATSTYMQFNTTDQWRVVTSGNETFRVNSGETYSRVVIRSAGDIVAFFSDERLKTKQGSIDNALQKILQLDGFYYTTNDLAKSVGYKEEGLQIGISAQQVRDILPEVVTLAPFDSKIDENGNLYSISGENYLTVKYEKMVPLIIEGIKDQQKIVNWNNTEVKKLKNIIEDQQKQIDELKEMIKSLIK